MRPRFLFESAVRTGCIPPVTFVLPSASCVSVVNLACPAAPFLPGWENFIFSWPSPITAAENIYTFMDVPYVLAKRCSSLAKHATNAKTCGAFPPEHRGSGGTILAWTHQGRDRILPVFAPLAALREKFGFKDLGKTEVRTHSFDIRSGLLCSRRLTARRYSPPLFGYRHPSCDTGNFPIDGRVTARRER
jgi:hypothetical protein